MGPPVWTMSIVLTEISKIVSLYEFDHTQWFVSQSINNFIENPHRSLTYKNKTVNSSDLDVPDTWESYQLNYKCPKSFGGGVGLNGLLVY